MPFFKDFSDMKIISYNVNGIRAAINKGFLDWLKAANPDVICLQEIKATPEQIPLIDFEINGYPYHYWYPAQKKGYSGVAVLSKIEPKKVVFGTGIDYMDFEGRNLRLDFEDFSVMSLYLPSGTNIDRLDHKFKYMDDFQVYVNNLKKKSQILLFVAITIFVMKLLIFMTQSEIKLFQDFYPKNELGLTLL